MPVSPTGFVSVTFDALARTFANCAGFRTLANETTEAGALSHIFYGQAFDHIAAQVPPRIIIGLDDAKSAQEGGIASSGKLSVRLEIPVGSSYLQSGTYELDNAKWNDAYLAFWNTAGVIWREADLLILNAAAGGYISASELEYVAHGLMIVGRDTADRKDENGATLDGKDCWFLELSVNWMGA